MELGSGVMDETVRWPDCCLEGGCKDFAFAVRVALVSFGIPEVMPWRLGMPAMSSRSKLLVGIIPGPTLFRGGRAAGLGGACEENWLWRRVRIVMLLGGWGTAGVLELDAAMPAPTFRAADWLKRRAKELLRAGRVSVGTPVNVGMLLVVL
jgi:hypothetical protein